MGAAEKRLPVTDEEALAALATLRAWLAPPTVQEVYTSNDLPPGCPSREAFGDRCRFVAGAYRDGKVWVCTVEAYVEAMRRGAVPKSERKRKPARRKMDHLAAVIAAGRR